MSPITPYRRAVINEAAARAYFPGQNPIGQMAGIRWSKSQKHGENLYTIVGVVGDLPDRAREKAPAPAMYVPFARTFWPLAHFVVRTKTEPLAMAQAVRRAVAVVDSTRAIELVQSVNTFVDSQSATERLETWMVGAFAAAAMLLAGIGIFGLVAGTVAERRVEIGIRMALGAEPARVLRETMGGLAVQVMLGLVAGLGLAFVTGSWMEKSLYGVKAADLPTYFGAALALLAMATMAAWWPARKAARMDPAMVLRREG